MTTNRRTQWVLTFVCAAFIAHNAVAQSKYSGIPEEHRKYTLAEGVTEKDVTYYSDGVACYARVFYPKGFDPAGKTPAIVLGQGWTGTTSSIVKYGARFAERGFLAMAIDYRGWGGSDGFPTVLDSGNNDDSVRFEERTARIRTKRTRLLPWKQVADYRNAISYIQGEPGADPDRIGVWGSSYAGGHVLTVASVDSRVKAAVSQVTGLNGYGMSEGPVPMSRSATVDAIKRAREGQGAEWRTGFSDPRMVDLETRQASQEYRPYHYVKNIPDTVAVLFVLAENDELINNDRAGTAAHAAVKGPKKLVIYPDIGHFDIYIEDHFEKASGEAADWFVKYLELK